MRTEQVLQKFWAGCTWLGLRAINVCWAQRVLVMIWTVMAPQGESALIISIDPVGQCWKRRHAADC
jgi:hypothetical protein